jgi:hypothetical protein
MAETLAELDFNFGAEIGVAKADHAEILCKANPNLHLYGIDAWAKYHGYKDYLQDRLNFFEKEARRKMEPYDFTIIKKYSMEALEDFEDGSLDFVYIDGAHDFKNVAMDVCEWSKKVRKGGIVYGHDFKRRPHIEGGYECHVVDVIQAYMYSHEIKPWFVLGETGHNDGMYREGTRAWMYIR